MQLRQRSLVLIEMELVKVHTPLQVSERRAFEAFSEWFNLRYSIVYFYNAYGDHEIANGRYATVVAKFIKLVQMGASEFPTSPGTQLRNFTHVEDIVDGIILAGFHGEGDDYGIGCDEKHSILDLLSI